MRSNANVRARRSVHRPLHATVMSGDGMVKCSCSLVVCPGRSTHGNQLRAPVPPHSVVPLPLTASCVYLMIDCEKEQQRNNGTTAAHACEK